MPAEPVRNFLQTHEADRPHRRWPVLPASIAAHAAAVLAILIIPLAAEVELPEPAPLSRSLHIIPVRMPPPPPAFSGPRDAPVKERAAAPLEAPSAIAAEKPIDETVHIAGPPVEGGLPFGTPDGLHTAVVLPPPPPALPPRPAGPVRVGQGIREPKKIVHVAPVYPAIARTAGVQGTVMLEAVINERGRVDNVRVLRSVTLLDNAAVEAVRAWRYTPTLLNGVPVPVLLSITINFQIDR